MYYLATITVVQGSKCCNLDGCLWLRISHGIPAKLSVWTSESHLKALLAQDHLQGHL